MKKCMTPLHALSVALCQQKSSKLFHNQVVMYQLLIPFMCDQLNAFSSDYAPPSVDELIADVRRYLTYVYYNPGGYIPRHTASIFSKMHSYIYNNLANRNSGLRMPPFRCRQHVLSVTRLRGEGNLESNISNTLQNRRPLPRKWKKLLRDNHLTYFRILYRCFWMLQYYFVFYGHQIDSAICTINPNAAEEALLSTPFIEYFPIEMQKSHMVFSALLSLCGSYSECIQETPEAINLLTLSQIILDTIIEQINNREQLTIKIPEANEKNIQVLISYRKTSSKDLFPCLPSGFPARL